MTATSEGPLAPPTGSILRWSLANSTGLSALYLVISAAVEVARRVGHARWSERLSLGLESLPARTLDVLGLLEPLRHRWMAGEVSSLGVRLIYGVTSIALIYLLGVMVAALMWGAVRAFGTRRPPA
jgi:hypothetical protein